METKKIIIVDDSSEMIDLLKNYLNRMGPHFSIYTETNGESAIERLNKDTFDLILLDEHIDDISGMDIIKSLSKGTTNSCSKVIYFSASMDRAHLQMAQMHGVRHFFPKPFTFANLNVTINKFFSI